MVTHVLAQIPLGIDRQDARMFSPLHLPRFMELAKVTGVAGQDRVTPLRTIGQMLLIAEATRSDSSRRDDCPAFPPQQGNQAVFV